MISLTLAFLAGLITGAAGWPRFRKWIALWAASVLLAACLTQPSPAQAVATHEPAGFLTLTDRECGAALEDGWRLDAGTLKNFRIVTDSTSPGTTPTVCETVFPGGMDDGRAPLTLERRFAKPVASLYVSYWVQPGPTFYGHSVFVKQFHAWIGGANREFPVIYGRALGALSQGAYVQRTGPTATTARDFRPVGGGALARGRWSHVEELLVGGAAGSLTLWVDGVQVTSASVNYAASGWTMVSWSPTWGGDNGSRVPAGGFTMRWDALHVSGR